MTWTIVIPLEVPSQNATGGGRNWQKRARLTRERRTSWRMHGLCEMNRQLIPRATGKRRVHLTCYRRRIATDSHNIHGGGKSCCDGLRDAGLMIDDSDDLAVITYEQRLRSHPDNPMPRAVCTVVAFEDLP